MNMTKRNTRSVLLTAFMAAPIAAAFSTPAFALDYPVTDADTFMGAANAATGGDTITIQPGSTVNLTGTINVNGAAIYLQAGSTLTGPATLNLDGDVAVAAITASGAGTTISNLTINDASNSLYAMTIVLDGPGTETVSNCTITGANNIYAVYSRGLTNAVITNNTMSTYIVPVYAEGTDTTTLTLKGNTFINSGELALDYAFLPRNVKSGSEISDNKFLDPNPPAHQAINFFNSLAGSTYIPVKEDFEAIIASNAANPIVVEDFDGAVAGSAVNTNYPADPIAVTFKDPEGNESSISVGSGAVLNSSQFPTVAGSTLTWQRSDGEALDAPITKTVTFTATAVKLAAAAAVPTASDAILAAIAMALAGLAAVMLRRRRG